MGKFNRDNLRKTVYYLKKNGIKNTILTAMERLQKKEYDDYTYEAPSAEVLETQRKRSWNEPAVFSIVVPVYHTPEKYFRELAESVLNQTYPYFELILADAGKDEQLKALAQSCNDSRIRYFELQDNAGISENTNQGFVKAKGDYIALLDHDDLLTADALYEMADALEKAKAAGIDPILIYSDEDKCDGDGKVFYEPHYKLDFDPDLLLTNNYICHFTAVKADVAKRLLLRKEYDGAQDFDFVLRVTAEAEQESILHVPKILYHWRCHTGSTAANPESKRYAYEAGKRAVENYVNFKSWNAEVTHLKHLGFYRVNYKEDIFSNRQDVAAVGGRILDKGKKIVGGMMDARGNVVFAGLRDGFSGYVNRAALVQQAQALDIRCMKINPVCQELVKKVCHGFVKKGLQGPVREGLQGPVREGLQGPVTEGFQGPVTEGFQGSVTEGFMESGKETPVMSDCISADGSFSWEMLPKGTDYRKLSLMLSKALKDAGYVLLWDPEMSKDV